MILLVYFISLFLGINIRLYPVLGIIESLILLIFIFIRFNKKIALFSLLFVLSGVGLSFIRPSFNKSVYQSVIIEVKENYYIASSTFEKFYIYEKDHSHEVGDILLLNGEKSDLSFNKIESSFDFKEYLYNKGIYQEFKIKSKNIVFSNPIKIHQLKKNFLSNFNDDTKALIKSILFGESESGETIELFKNLHLTRLISNSGMFLSLFYVSFVFVLKFCLKEEKAKIVAFILFFIYSFFTFPRFVVIKFLFVNIFRFINIYKLNKRFSYLEILSMSGIFFLLIDYHLGYQDSFFLTYFIPILSIFVLQSFKRFNKYFLPFILPVIIAFFFLPYSVKYYKEISILSILFQYLYTPFLYIFSLFSFISFIGVPLYKMLEGFTSFLNGTLSYISPLFLKIYVPSFSLVGTHLYYFIYLLILYFISIGFVAMLRIFVPLFSISLAIYIAPIKPLILTTISFIDVGQGNSCLIHQGTTSVMIDTGGNIYQDIAKNTLIPYLKKEQIYNIDLLITTHDDYDHMGAAESLIDNFKVKRYVKDYRYFPLQIGRLNLINYNIYPSLWSEENDSSLVIEFNIKNTSFLIMGDAPKKIEKEILKDNPDIDTDILLVGHHGSNTSSDLSFIKKISPKEAIISCGRNNKYGHPHQEVLSILNKEHIKIRRTDLEGTIKYSFLL